MTVSPLFAIISWALLCGYVINSLTCHSKSFTFWAQWTFPFTGPHCVYHFNRFHITIPFFIHATLCWWHFSLTNPTHPWKPSSVLPPLWSIPVHSIIDPFYPVTFPCCLPDFYHSTADHQLHQKWQNNHSFQMQMKN